MAKNKKIEVQEDREWLVSGQITLDGVRFFVTAKSEDEVIEKSERQNSIRKGARRAPKRFRL